MLVNCENSTYVIDFYHSSYDKNYLENNTVKSYLARVTICMILEKVGENYNLVCLGKSTCDSRDRYNKALGRIIALWYALKGIESTSLKMCLFYNYFNFFMKTNSGKKNILARDIIKIMEFSLKVLKRDNVVFNDTYWKQAI